MSEFKVGDKVKIDEQFLYLYNFCSDPSFVWEVTYIFTEHKYMWIHGPGGRWDIDLVPCGQWSVDHFKKYNENPIWCE